MKRIILFAVLGLIILLSTCTEKQFDIAGTWEIEKTEIYIEGMLVETIEDTGEKLTFNSDGTGKSGEFYFEWEMKNDILYITELGQRIKYIIKEKDLDMLVLEDREFFDELGELEILTLKR